MRKTMRHPEFPPVKTTNRAGVPWPQSEPPTWDEEARCKAYVETLKAIRARYGNTERVTELDREIAALEGGPIPAEWETEPEEAAATEEGAVD